MKKRLPSSAFGRGGAFFSLDGLLSQLLNRFGNMQGYLLKTTQLWDQGTGSPKSVTTLSAAFRYQE